MDFSDAIWAASDGWCVEWEPACHGTGRSLQPPARHIFPFYVFLFMWRNIEWTLVGKKRNIF
jgi:hypothetical protein